VIGNIGASALLWESFQVKAEVINIEVPVSGSPDDSSVTLVLNKEKIKEHLVQGDDINEEDNFYKAKGSGLNGCHNAEKFSDKYNIFLKKFSLVKEILSVNEGGKRIQKPVYHPGKWGSLDEISLNFPKLAIPIETEKRVDGIYNCYYKIPSCDFRKQTKTVKGEDGRKSKTITEKIAVLSFSNSKKTSKMKTVYDPALISDDKMVGYCVEATQKAKITNFKKGQGENTDDGGSFTGEVEVFNNPNEKKLVQFQGFFDKDRNITSIFPILNEFREDTSKNFEIIGNYNQNIIREGLYNLYYNPDLSGLLAS